ncbi:unnamed protein product, partial [Mesorhabditis belari]|uniref:Uncharacterized protein n=1 Tax=Mesorhabditis belari TaxID=2138241 RepID=A0AAF3EFG8_9BILA
MDSFPFALSLPSWLPVRSLLTLSTILVSALLVVFCRGKKLKEKPKEAKEAKEESATKGSTPKAGEMAHNDPNYETMNIIQADPFAKKE